PESDVVTMVVERDPRLRTMAVFDALANNADRKGGHILPMTDGHVYGVDHGICFAVEPKLRTVLWGWRGDALTEDELGVVRRVCDALDGGSLGAALGELLSGEEVRATSRRAEALLSSGLFPEPDPSRPALPWPPF
ncbi:MAG TPA: phosphatidylinositol kinase, partial [Aeromicrobium sp.]|nr:phosphatidylinositol kinase [Aeromicrobium sp.]